MNVSGGTKDQSNKENEKADTTSKLSVDQLKWTPMDEVKYPSDITLPDANLAVLRHTISLPAALTTPEEQAEAKAQLMVSIEGHFMGPFYKTLCNQYSWTIDETLLKRLEDSNKAELTRLELAIEDAATNYGDVEIRDAVFRKAHFFCRIGDVARAKEEYGHTFEKTVGAGGRLDVVHTLLRLGLCEGNNRMAKENIDKAKSELKRGGDWERMNKLKVYEAIYLMSLRKFKEAGKLLLEAVSTFTATELLPFETLIFYAIILGLLSLDRPTLKAKIIDSPEVLQVLGIDEDLREFLDSFYHCNYSTFMRKLIPISKRVQKDRILWRHYRYFVRNIRLQAYAQFLEPYKSVTLKSMSEAFGVSEDFIEDEVSSFIAGGRLNSKIDRVNFRVESNRRDDRDALYLKTLKEGDFLLNRVQKLSRVVDM